LQWQGPYEDGLKLDQTVGDQIEKSKRSQDGIAAQADSGGKGGPPETDLFAIQLVKDPDSNKGTLDLIDQFKTEPIKSQFEILKYVNVIVAVLPDKIKAIASRPDVVSIQPYILPKLRDERQNQIIAGNLTGNLPTPGDYLAYLAGKGFTQAQP
jgi:hypothetical protein